jgi:hypothetical protein
MIAGVAAAVFLLAFLATSELARADRGDGSSSITGVPPSTSRAASLLRMDVRSTPSSSITGASFDSSQAASLRMDVRSTPVFSPPPLPLCRLGLVGVENRCVGLIVVACDVPISSCSTTKSAEPINDELEEEEEEDMLGLLLLDDILFANVHQIAMAMDCNG